MISLRKREKMFIEIFVRFSHIERMIEFILDGQNIRYNQKSFGDKVTKFKLYLDRRPNKSVNTNEKIFNNAEHSLEDVLSGIQKCRNIVAHEAGFLIYDVIEEIPIKMPGIRLIRKQHNGSLEDLYADFIKHTIILFHMYEMTDQIGYKAFEVFDINGTQIGEY